jgi:hypothetical protein
MATSDLLPSGYLSTSGNQIVSASGTAERIDAIGWFGTDGAAGHELTGLTDTSFTDILNTIKADGFSTIHLPWSDVNLTVTHVPGCRGPSPTMTG